MPIGTGGARAESGRLADDVIGGQNNHDAVRIAPQDFVRGGPMVGAKRAAGSAMICDRGMVREAGRLISAGCSQRRFGQVAKSVQAIDGFFEERLWTEKLEELFGRRRRLSTEASSASTRHNYRVGMLKSCRASLVHLSNVIRFSTPARRASAVPENPPPRQARKLEHARFVAQDRRYSRRGNRHVSPVSNHQPAGVSTRPAPSSTESTSTACPRPKHPRCCSVGSSSAKVTAAT
jgi:hypothetical protein